jgi:ubiquinone/menaquinone biosynthesis C-methylase UbiE
MDLYRQVQTTYDQMVLEFAKRNHFSMSDNLVALAQQMVEHIGQEGIVVDVGCGTGRDMAWFELHRIRTIGVDLSMGMLAYAKENVHGELISMNMRNLGFCDAYFDGVWCCASLLHLPKVEAVYALQEIRRILKVGGMLILSIQEGNDEGWEDGSIAGAKRFFARYQENEMKDLLAKNRFAVLKTDSSQTVERNWLSFVCNAK